MTDSDTPLADNPWRDTTPVLRRGDVADNVLLRYGILSSGWA